MPASLHAAATAAAARDERSLAATIRMLLKEYVAAQEQEDHV
jgi:hypothetical protein